jgi:hypothetical protein
MWLLRSQAAFMFYGEGVVKRYHYDFSYEDSFEQNMRELFSGATRGIDVVTNITTYYSTWYRSYTSCNAVSTLNSNAISKCAIIASLHIS